MLSRKRTFTHRRILLTPVLAVALFCYSGISAQAKEPIKSPCETDASQEMCRPSPSTAVVAPPLPAQREPEASTHQKKKRPASSQGAKKKDPPSTTP